MNEFPGELQQLFKSYGEFHADMDGAPEFMPRLWAKIEARRSPVFAIRRMAQMLAAGSLAAALVLSMVVIPFMETKRPAGHFADVVVQDDTRADQEYASTLPLPSQGFEGSRK